LTHQKSNQDHHTQKGSVKSYLYLIPAICWCILILILSFSSPENLPSVSIIGIDKFAHLAVYFVLSFLACFGFVKYGYSLKNTMILSLLIASSFGIMVEFAQKYFFSSRSFEELDIIANIIGTILGICIFRLFKKRYL